jgi:hypothetical protein
MPYSAPFARSGKMEQVSHRAITAALLFACVILSLLAFEQDRTIQSQRALINSLFHDSLELNAVKMQRSHDIQHR